jgi:hypothetical protein
VGLPEIGNMPHKTASVASRGTKLSFKELSPTQINKLYMNHIHAIGFRVVGEVFSALPKCNEVVISAFASRTDTSSGQIKDDYLYSVRIKRSEWSELNFSNIVGIDVVDVFTRFDFRRDMSKTGLFKAVIPIKP